MTTWTSEELDTIQEELRLYDERVAEKPQIVAANKIDALHDQDALTRLTRHVRARKLPIIPISGVTGEGVPELLEAAWREVARGRSRGTDDTHTAVERPESESIDLLTPAPTRRDT